jgi:hypothetical protein
VGNSPFAPKRLWRTLSANRPSFPNSFSKEGSFDGRMTSYHCGSIWLKSAIASAWPKP